MSRRGTRNQQPALRPLFLPVPLLQALMMGAATGTPHILPVPLLRALMLGAAAAAEEEMRIAAT